MAVIVKYINESNYVVHRKTVMLKINYDGLRKPSIDLFDKNKRVYSPLYAEIYSDFAYFKVEDTPISYAVLSEKP